MYFDTVNRPVTIEEYAEWLVAHGKKYGKKMMKMFDDAADNDD